MMSQWVERDSGWEVTGAFGMIRIAPDYLPTAWPHSMGRLRAIAFGAISVVDHTAGGVWWPGHHTHEDLRSLMRRCEENVEGVIQWSGDIPRVMLTRVSFDERGLRNFEVEILHPRPQTWELIDALD